MWTKGACSYAAPPNSAHLALSLDVWLCPLLRAAACCRALLISRTTSLCVWKLRLPGVQVVRLDAFRDLRSGSPKGRLLPILGHFFPARADLFPPRSGDKRFPPLTTGTWPI
eukprot:359797-Chlamydomonas_euryale.AAC.2